MTDQPPPVPPSPHPYYRLDVPGRSWQVTYWNPPPTHGPLHEVLVTTWADAGEPLVQVHTRTLPFPEVEGWSERRHLFLLALLYARADVLTAHAPDDASDDRSAARAGEEELWTRAVRGEAPWRRRTVTVGERPVPFLGMTHAGTEVLFSLEPGLRVVVQDLRAEPPPRVLLDARP